MRSPSPGLLDVDVHRVGEAIAGVVADRDFEYLALGIAIAADDAQHGRAALDAALQSEEGQAAGAFLHQFTGKRFTMLISEHKEAVPEEFIREDKE